ncbi:uracil-xanthine permease family protein [Curvivirga aplysinae]|uniref:uracil-xanthine permease family protein n=1 Tax=Curvivirga aplysinae TaxID=2529852 RepID=UPI0012BC7A81|nr:uracil-xanthine permease family protein [Curvivirga aplysinae]MTI10217.1 uracil-xanthine permease [Curvivirga aplysinae]
MKSDISNTEYLFRPGQWFIGGQMMFVAFGALVLVPLLTGLDPNVALFTAGLGTLIFQICTRGQVPVFLASSFAFIAPIIYGVQTWGIPATLSGLAAAGLLYVVISFVIRIKGSEILTKFLPPVVTGPVIMVIGLILAPVGVNLALGKTGDGAGILVAQSDALIIAGASLGTTLIAAIMGRGLIRIVPILLGVIVGYVTSILLGMFTGNPIVDFAAVGNASWFTIPDFTLPEWNWQAVLFILPVALAPAIEHFGDILAIRSVTGKDYLKKPGIQNTMLGDGLATSAASFLGGPPNTTYSEVTGAVALTRAFNPAIMTWAAVWAIALSFVGKLGAVLQTIPTPVMGGILVLLFGMITVVGLNTLVKSKDDIMTPRNMIIISMILVLGIGGLEVSVGGFALGGIGLAGIVGIVLNLILPAKIHIEKEEEA